MPRIGVVGIGNVLMGDDALGPTVVKLLEAEFELPPIVEVLELGTPGNDLSLHLDGLERAIVVDTINAPGAPGEPKILEKAQLLAARPSAPASPHEPGLREALFTLELHGKAPADVRVVGAIPASVEMGAGLSAPIRGAVPAVLAEILRQLSAMGVVATRRPVPRSPDLWWERGLGRSD